jgi:Transcriptional regulator
MGRPKIYNEELREALLVEAEDMLAKEGYHDVSLRVLTKNVGTSTNAVYTLFGSKEALMSEVIVRGMTRRMDDALERSAGLSPLEKLLFLAGIFRESALGSPKRFRGIFDASKEIRKSNPSIGRVHPEAFHLGDKVFGPITDAVKGIVSEEGIDADPVLMAGTIWAAIHGLITLEVEGLTDNHFSDPTDLYLSTIGAVLGGWKGCVEIPENARNAFLMPCGEEKRLVAA